MTKTLPWQVRSAVTPEDRGRVFEFRYKVYVDELGKPLENAEHKLTDPLDDQPDSVILYADRDNEVVATLRSNRSVPEDFQKAYGLGELGLPKHTVSFTSKLMVAPEWRGSMVVAELIATLYRMQRDQGVRVDVIGCGPGLVSLYEHLGYRRYTSAFHDEHAGLLVPMLLVVRDMEHLLHCKSPLARMHKESADDGEMRRWFQDRFPDPPTGRTSVISEEELWLLITEKMHAAPREKSGLFKDLTDAESQSLLHHVTMLRLQEGEHLIQQGDWGREMYVVVQGAFEARLRHGVRMENVRALDVFGPGDVFGEMAFFTSAPRSCSVVALTLSEVLVLNQDVFKSVLEPSLAGKVALNIVSLLCDKLRRTTQPASDTTTQPASDTARPEVGHAGSYDFNTFGAEELERLQRQARLRLPIELQALRNAGLAPGMVVLDLACGPGVVSIEIAKAVQPHGRVVGLDHNETLLAAAQRLAQPMAEQAPAEFVRGDAYNLEQFAEGTFDFVYARFLFQHLEHPRKALAEALRVLKPGGRMFAADGDDGLLLVHPEPRAWASVTQKAAEGQKKRGGDRHVGRKLAGMFEDTGLVDVRADVVTLTSKDLGMSTFLDITTGFKKEQLKGLLPDPAISEHLASIYSSLTRDASAFASVGVFAVAGTKPVSARL